MACAIRFELEAVCPVSGARAGRLITPHGEIETPVFMPVGTNATVKALTGSQLRELGCRLVLANSYHLYLRPGHQLIERMGGLHAFMSWDSALLTDSGGYQVFSLDALRQIENDGVHFKDHRTGEMHFIGPERSMEIQNALGADVIMAFDDCVKNPASYDQARAAMERTHRWLEACVVAHKRPAEQALFGIVQGSIYEDLRRQSLRMVTAFDLPGYAIGGVAVGEDRQAVEKIVRLTAPLLPANKPRYLMGVGTPWDILWSVACGLDMFDCVLPTRLARHGAAFTDAGRVSLRQAAFAEDALPLVPGCSCYACQRHSRSYIHHLVRLKEITAAVLLSIHNIHHLHDQTKALRRAIIEGCFADHFRNQARLAGRTI